MTIADMTYEQVLDEMLKLSPADRAQVLDSVVGEPPIRPLKSLAELAAEQGKGPIDFEELLKLGEFFPAEESVDDLIAFVRESRTDRRPQSL